MSSPWRPFPLIVIHICKLSQMDTYRACARTHVHSHTHIRTNTLQSSVMVLPVPLPCPPLPATLFLPCAYSEKCNGFRSFRECCGVKNLYCVLSLFCSITAELRSKLSLLCILFLLFLQHPAPPLSMSAFDMHVKKKKVYLLLKKRRRRKKGWMLNCCFRLCVFFFLYFSVPFTSLSLPFPPWLEWTKSIHIVDSGGLSGENVWKKKHLAQNELGALLAWPAVHNHWWCSVYCCPWLI